MAVIYKVMYCCGVVLAAALMTATPAWGCFLEGTDYPGNDIDRLLGKVYSAVECQRHCQSNKKCERWTFQPSTSSCYMKGGEGEVAPTPAEGLISGPRICPGPVDCSQEGIDLYGGDIIDTQVANSVACQFQCTAVAGCAYWTFIPSSSRCYLKGPSVDPQTHSEAVSGPRECPAIQPISCEASTDFLGHDLLSFLGTVSNAQTCQRLCRSFNNCFYWTFVQSSSSCYLKDASAAEAREYNPLTLSGLRDCDLSVHPTHPVSTTTTPAPPPSSCLLHNYDYQGADITAFGMGAVTSPEACQLLCQYTHECSYFTFYQGTCYFKGEDAPSSAVYKPDAVSGPKYCSSNATTTTTTTSPTSTPAPTTTSTTSTTASTTATTTTTSADATSSSSSVDTLLRFLRAPGRN